MNEKINLNQIIEEMNQRFPENSLSEIEKAKYLYIELGKKLKYDINYESNYKFIREEALYKPVDYNNIIDDTYTCFQISDIYAELLKKAGINVESIYEKNNIGKGIEHKYVEIKLKDGRKIIADLTYDLGYIQKGMRMSNFGSYIGTDQYDLISFEENQKIDEKLGYALKYNDYPAVYLETAIEMMKEDLNNEESLKEYIKSTYSEEECKKYKPEYLVKYKMDLICRYFNLKDMGFREADTFLKYMYDSFFSHDEKKHLSKHLVYNGFDFPESISNLRCYIYTDSEGKKDYYLYEKGQNLRCVSKYELTKVVSKKNYRNANEVLEK